MSGKSNRTPWLIVGALGCLVLCLCFVVVGGVGFAMFGTDTSALIAQLSGVPSPTLPPSPTATRVALGTTTPLPSVTRSSGPTVTPTRPPINSPTPGSNSPSPTPQCPPSPALAPGILFNDDFGSLANSECNGWLLSPGQNVDYTWAQNKYTISVKETDYLGFDWPDGEYDDFAAEIEAQPTGDGIADFGIAFRISGTKDNRSYYAYGLTSDGTFFVLEKLKGTWVDDDPVKSTTSSAIKQGKTKNTIGIIARGSTFSLYINRSLVKTFTDASIAGTGAVGIFAGSHNTKTAVTFSRVTVLKPEKAQTEWK